MLLRRLARGRRRGRLAGAALVVGVAVAAFALVAHSSSPAPVTVGAGSSEEQHVLAALAADALRDAGIPAVVRADLGGTPGLRGEALRGTVDVFWDYTGAAWALGLREQAPPAAPEESFERVRSADAARGLVWLAPTQANATLALFVRAEDVPEAQRPATMTWLAAVLSSGDKRLCADADFLTRPAGYEALASFYAIDRARLRLQAASEDEAVAGVASGECFAGLATATSGEARRAELVPVVDDLMVFPAFVVAPVATAGALQAHPQLAAVMQRLASSIDTAALARLNAQVPPGADTGAVARRFLDGGAQ